MEVLFDEPHLPQVIGSLEVLEVVASVNVDEVKLAVFGRVALLGEPLVEDQIILLRLARDLASDDECPTAIGRGTSDHAKPIRAVPSLL